MERMISQQHPLDKLYPTRSHEELQAEAEKSLRRQTTRVAQERAESLDLDHYMQKMAFLSAEELGAEHNRLAAFLEEGGEMVATETGEKKNAERTIKKMDLIAGLIKKALEREKGNS